MRLVILSFTSKMSLSNVPAPLNCDVIIDENNPTQSLETKIKVFFTEDGAVVKNTQLHN